MFILLQVATRSKLTALNSISVTLAKQPVLLQIQMRFDNSPSLLSPLMLRSIKTFSPQYKRVALIRFHLLTKYVSADFKTSHFNKADTRFNNHPSSTIQGDPSEVPELSSDEDDAPFSSCSSNTIQDDPSETFDLSSHDDDAPLNVHPSNTDISPSALPALSLDEEKDENAILENVDMEEAIAMPEDTVLAAWKDMTRSRQDPNCER